MLIERGKNNTAEETKQTRLQSGKSLEANCITIYIGEDLWRSYGRETIIRGEKV